MAKDESSSQLWKQDEDLTQEKKAPLAKVEELDESLSSDRSLPEPNQLKDKSLSEPKFKERLEQLQREIIDSQSKLFRQQAQYNEQLLSLSSASIGTHSSFFMEKTGDFVLPKETGEVEESQVKTAILASEIARSVNSITARAESEIVYQTHKSPFVLQQMAKGKRVDLRAQTNTNPV